MDIRLNLERVLRNADLLARNTRGGYYRFALYRLLGNNLGELSDYEIYVDVELEADDKIVHAWYHSGEGDYDILDLLDDNDLERVKNEILGR